LNPPYCRGLIDRFLDKLRSEREAGHVTQAIVLITALIHNLALISSAIALVKGRIRFYNDSGTCGSAENGSVARY
jgi:hypothetical protein